jgi:hypothetical protein
MLPALLLVFFISISCRIQQGRIGSHMPHVLIYKTKADYSKYVPVTLSDDKARIISYPAPQDVYTGGRLAVPTQLSGGYWLDHRGVGPNSCFIKITYEDYARFSQAPGLDEMYNLIIDKSPFKAMYDMGPRSHFADEARDIDSIIRHHHLKEFKKLL